MADLIACAWAVGGSIVVALCSLVAYHLARYAAHLDELKRGGRRA